MVNCNGTHLHSNASRTHGLRITNGNSINPLLAADFTENLVSVVICCAGQLEYTKLCVPSILRYSREPYELIFLDIGSLDGTADYLAGIQAASKIPITIVQAMTDLEIGEAVSEALWRAGGEYIVLLNNDTVVTDSWLNQLTGLVTAAPIVGLGGPMSNCASPLQLVEMVPYRIGPIRGSKAQSKTLPENFLVDVGSVNDFAMKSREEHAGKWREVDRLGGFCLIVKRAVLEKIASLTEPPEWNDLKVFDAAVLCTKARQAGYSLACCRDLFIHHFGSRDFAQGAPR